MGWNDKHVPDSSVIGGTITEIGPWSAIRVLGTDGLEYEIKIVIGHDGPEYEVVETSHSVAMRGVATRKRNKG